MFSMLENIYGLKFQNRLTNDPKEVNCSHRNILQWKSDCRRRNWSVTGKQIKRVKSRKR